MRDAAKERIEDAARERGISEITLDIAEEVLARARDAMAAVRDPAARDGGEPPRKCPFATLADGVSAAPDMLRNLISGERAAPTSPGHLWTQAALAQLDRVPLGYCRDMTVKAAETIAGQQGLEEIDAPFVMQLMEIFKSGSDAVAEELPWDEAARERIGRAPPMVRGMLAREIEGWARRHDMKRVDIGAVEAVKRAWQTHGAFHLDPNDPRSQ